MSKGITPVIAIILLLLMTVAAAGAAYIWISRVQEQISSQTSTGLEANLQQMYMRLGIDSVWNQTTRLCLTIRNQGMESLSEDALNNTAIYIAGSAVDWTYISYSSGGLSSGAFTSVCICDGTVEGDCTASSLAYEYSCTHCAPYPLVEVKIEPTTGTGDTYQYRYNA